MQYIDKDTLVAEIRKRLLPVIRDKHYGEWEEGEDSERIAILDIINTLEVKEVYLDKVCKELIDKASVIGEIEKLESPIYPTLAEKLAYEDAIEECKDIILNSSIKTKEVDLQSEVSKWLRNNENVIHMEFARHFFNLGLNAKEK
jgi:hypothetical protein